MTENKSNQTKAVELETKRWTKFVSEPSQWWGKNLMERLLFILQNNYLFWRKTQIQFHLIKVTPSKKTRKRYLIDIIKKNWYTNIRKIKIY